MKDAFNGFLVGVLVGVYSLVVIARSWPEYTVPYKQGQVDAANGKMRYVLTQNPDGTTAWEMVK